MDFDLLTHHRPIFLLHDDSLHFLFRLVAEANSDEIAQKIEICSINRSSKTSTLLKLQIDYFIIDTLHLPYFNSPILNNLLSTSEQLMIYFSDYR